MGMLTYPPWSKMQRAHHAGRLKEPLVKETQLGRQQGQGRTCSPGACGWALLCLLGQGSACQLLGPDIAKARGHGERGASFAGEDH